MIRNIFIIPLLLLCCSFMQQGGTKKKLNVTVTSEEQELYRLINEYRKSSGLTDIPLSASLTFVAQQHCIDMQEKLGKLSHSWSTCNFDKDNNCMWLKPQEMTNYKGYGFECAHANSDTATASSALSGWKRSKLHNDVIVNQGAWKRYQWQAIGIGIYGNYACIWFGKETDPDGGPALKK